ncbi:hypothetical protein GGI22_000668, partial [Coemansia erecta]
MDRSGAHPGDPAMESNTTSPAESVTGTSSGDDDHRTTLADSQLVSDDANTPDSSTDDDSAGSDSSTPSSPTAPTEQEPDVEPLRMAHQRQQLEEAGICPLAIDVMLRSAAQITRNRSYTPVQNQFVSWCTTAGTDPLAASAAHIINFLAVRSSERNWSPSTVLAYRSALLDLQPVSTRATIASDPLFAMFFHGLFAHVIREIEQPPVRIQAIFDHIRATPCSALTPMQLAQRVCWLLCVVGFLRPADLARIEADKIEFVDNHVRLSILAPKEKRRGLRIRRPVYIHRFADAALCPVAHLEYYLTRAVLPHLDTRTLHPSIPELSYVPLMRKANNYREPITADRIASHVRTLMALGAEPGTRASARSLGVDTALRNGADRDLVRTHGNWVNDLTVEMHYQRSRLPATSMTDL